jgi:hypothetical protein
MAAESPPPPNWNRTENTLFNIFSDGWLGLCLWKGLAFVRCALLTYIDFYVYTVPLSVQAMQSRSFQILAYDTMTDVTWTVVSLTASKFKPLVFSLSGFALSYTANIFIHMILYDFCLLPYIVRLSPLGTATTTGLLLYQPQKTDDGDCGAVGGMRIGRGNRITRRKPAPVPLCPPQIPNDLTRARTRAATLGRQRLTA